MHSINPRKLKNSKWTAVHPQNKAKHFLVTQVTYGELGEVVSCELEAILSRETTDIDWRILKDPKHWKPGWCAS